MFNEKEIKAYRSIKPDPSLKIKVTALEKNKEDFKRKALYKPALAFALCLFMISLTFFNLHNNSTGIILDGHAVTSEGYDFTAKNEPQAAVFMRSTPDREVKFEVKLRSDGILTCKSGSLSLLDRKSGEVIDEGTSISLGKKNLVSYTTDFSEDVFYLSLLSEGKEEFYNLTFYPDGSYCLKKN